MKLVQKAESRDLGNITTSQITRDRFVHGMRDLKVRERLLREKNLTLEKSMRWYKQPQNRRVSCQANRPSVL